MLVYIWPAHAPNTRMRAHKNALAHSCRTHTAHARFLHARFSHAHTGDIYEPCGSLAHYTEYHNPPKQPILVALTDGLSIRQTATGFPLMISPTSTSMPFKSGHIEPHKVVMIPETGVFDDLDIAAEVQQAKVRAWVCRCM